MTVAFPDSPGDCPIGMNCSVIFCAEAGGWPLNKSALIPTTPTTNFRTFMCLSSLPSFNENCPRLLLVANGCLRVLPVEEYTLDGLLGHPSGVPKVGDSVGVETAAFKHTKAVPRLAYSTLEEPLSLLGGRHRETRLQQHDALADI